MSAVRHFFDRRAGAYQAASARFPWSLLRAREAAAARKVLGAVKGAEILELGCGAGYYTRLLLEQGAASVDAVDISAAMAARLPDGAVAHIGDAAEIRLNKIYPHVVSFGMLEFSDDAGAVLANARRHAEDGGKLVILAPVKNFFGRLYRLRHKANGLNITLFEPERLRAMLGRAGWRIEDQQTVFPFTLLIRAAAVPVKDAFS